MRQLWGAELTAKNQHSRGVSHMESAQRALYDWGVGDTTIHVKYSRKHDTQGALVTLSQYVYRKQ